MHPQDLDSWTLVRLFSAHHGSGDVPPMAEERKCVFEGPCGLMRKH